MKNIYVGNLDLKTTAESLRSFFEPVGTVHNLKLMTDRNTSLSRGFGFIDMADPETDKSIATLAASGLKAVRLMSMRRGRNYTGPPPKR